MNIQEILNMVDEDIARAEEQQPDNKEENIDFLLSELEASRELDRTGLRKNTWPCTLCINSLPDRVILSKYLTVKISLR